MVVLSKTEISNDTIKFLYQYQVPQVINMINSIVAHKVVLDNSDTGCGKSRHALAVCMELGYTPMIICPKLIISSWHDLCKIYGIKPLLIVNYETARSGKMYTNSKCKYRVKSPYYKPVIHPEEFSMWNRYEWNIPPKTILIFDEAHCCKKINTENGKFLMSTWSLIKSGIPVIMCSATISDKYQDMKIPLFLFRQIDQPNNLNMYLKKSFGKNSKKKDYCLLINEVIAGKFSSRLRSADLKELFPKHRIVVQNYLSDHTEEICLLYDKLLRYKEQYSKVKGKILVKLQKIKMKIELLKVPIYIDEARSYMEKGCSVILIVNYKKTFNELVVELGAECHICGDTSLEERQNMIKNFQKNKHKLIILQIQTGGIGISLHDLEGANQRVVLINFPDRASGFLQAIGRAPRAGGKSAVLTKVISISNVPYEEKMKHNLIKKLSNISSLNDKITDGHKMEELEHGAVI